MTESRHNYKATPAEVTSEVLAVAASGATLEVIFDRLARGLRKLTDFDIATLEWVRGETAVVGAIATRVATTLQVGYTYPFRGTATGWVVRHRRPLVKALPWLFPLVKIDPPLCEGTKATLTVPIVSQDRVAAVVRLASARRQAFKKPDVQRVRQVLNELGENLIKARSNGKAEFYQKLQKEQQERLLLINTLAHELKTPLTAILASGGLLLEELQKGASEEHRKLAENIVRAASKLEARLAELVEMARSEKTGMSLKLELFDIRPMLENIAAIFQPVAAAKRQSLTLELEKDVPLVMGDRQRLEQVVMNLLSNASKFTPNGGKIWLQLAREGKRLVVKVRDNGPGISDEEQEKLFRPYYRVEADRQRFEGLGLGLALCKQIIDAHGGHIWVQSRRGEGSTFAFSLPIPELDKMPPHGTAWLELTSAPPVAGGQSSAKPARPGDDEKNQDE